MRSKNVHAAMAQGSTKFEICQMVAKGVRMTHKQGTRLEDSISQVLVMLGAGPNTQPVSVPPTQA